MALGHGDKGRGRLETELTRGPVDESKQAGKQQIQGETGERGIGWGGYFQVSGLGRREPAPGLQVQVQVQDLSFPAPAPVPDNPYLRPESRDL